ncbi:hypothetical protein ONS95_011270 [Cadophora gregata]|uniref:uncharacterized protein n=1 Tax=Cadophora gregata TaxID=51156 RepID=UPI0026DD28E4|nr:uncharacterized protein ONS95_011270 [Cadophora gregata]KAK0119838.1 hypothetical protein ONS95_011270 [Cadophora gregata]KAK0120873.1 hypothetical protein ONS96_011073 [Cadophora gregata f. sp. sojae]
MAFKEQSILEQQQHDDRERQKQVAEEEHGVILQHRISEREREMREAKQDQKTPNEVRERKRQQLEEHEGFRQVQVLLDQERRRLANEEVSQVALTKVEEKRRAAEQVEATRYHHRVMARAEREHEELERSQQDRPALAISARQLPTSETRNMHLQAGMRVVRANVVSQDQQKLHERHKDIVSAAIEAAAAQATSAQKRSHAEFDERPNGTQLSPRTFKKPENVFSRMMRAPQKVTDSPRDFSHWDAHLQQALDDQVSAGYVRNEADWATTITKTIQTSLESMIFPYIRHRAHPQTKINALHVLIETATATAYAPRSTAADMIRNSSLPRTLLSCMLEIAEKMSGSERKTVLEEQAFLHKVKTLRYQPMISWNGNTWTALDELLRLMKDPGPVGFRMIFDQLSSQIGSGRGVTSIATGVRRIIKSDITSYVTPSTCFELEDNAMNVLADAGTFAMKVLGTQYRAPADLFGEIAVALSELGKMLDGDEIRQIHSEMIQDPNFSAANFLDHFLECIDDDIVTFKTVNNHQFKHDYGFRSRSCAAFQLFVDKKRSQMKRTHGNDGLLAKILLLRWNHILFDPSWSRSQLALDDLLELLVDSSVPLSCDRYHWKIDSALHNAGIEGSSVYARDKVAKDVRTAVDRNISHVLALGRKGCMETKMNAFKALVKIGMRMVEWICLLVGHDGNSIFSRIICPKTRRRTR